MSGTYQDAGEHGGKRYYQRVPNGWTIWWFDPVGWVISPTPGVPGADWWEHFFLDIEGSYDPKGGALGDATVTEI